MKQLSENKYELDVACDFGCLGYMKAQDFIQGKFNPDYDPEKTLHWIVKVPSQDLPAAVALAYAVDCRIELDFELRQDEWTLTGYYFDRAQGGKIVSMTVWSPGA